MKTFLLFLLLSLPNSSFAGVYKWIDDNGKVHYGDSPKASTPSVEMQVDTSTPDPAASDEGDLSRKEKRDRLLQSMQEDRIEKQRERDKQREVRKQNKQKCNYYKDKMRRFSRANALYKLDEDGNRVYMSDNQREASTRDLQKQINRYCH